MRACLLILFLLLFTCSLPAEDRFGDPVQLFSGIYVPVMNGFEKTIIKTTLRGFIIRADSSPGIRQDQPSTYGISLIVSIGDADRKAVDKVEKEGNFTRRLIQIPAPAHEETSLVIEFCYGPEVSPEMVAAITKRCEALKAL